MYHFDYIISGAGASGLSLLMRMMQRKEFNNKKILVVDKAPKNINDRTWCYWEKQPGLFEPVVHHSWKQVHFFSEQFSSLLNLHPYSYKMIRSIDFYNYILKEAQKRSNIQFIYGNVYKVGNEANMAFADVDDKRYTADFLFNSILFSPLKKEPGKHYLLQHFKGYMIESEEPAFDPLKATLMDFRISQKEGTSFVYVLPVSPKKALIEYTLFSADLLQPDEYTRVLKEYIAQRLQLANYTIEEEEFGIIPMTNIRFEKNEGRVINIGTAGGQTKGSSGYTFQFIQKLTEKLVNDLLQFGIPSLKELFFEKRFPLYDAILLNVLDGNKLSGKRIFSDLFKKNPTDRVLRFLDNESSVTDEIKLMATLPQLIFMKAAFAEIFR